MNKYLEMLLDKDKFNSKNTPNEVLTKPTKGTSVSDVSDTNIVLLKNKADLLSIWLTHIGEDNEQTISELKGLYSTDINFKQFVDAEASQLRLIDQSDDDRRYCTDCKNLTNNGLCIASSRREIKAAPPYYPPKGKLHRCEGYKPTPKDLDQRSALNRGPFLKRTKH